MGWHVAILSGDQRQSGTPGARRRAWPGPEAMAWELLPEQKLERWCAGASGGQLAMGGGWD